MNDERRALSGILGLGALLLKSPPIKIRILGRTVTIEFSSIRDANTAGHIIKDKICI